MLRCVTPIAFILLSISWLACSSDEEEEGTSTSVALYGFVVGSWNVDASPLFSTCAQPASASEETWAVSNLYAGVNVTIPDVPWSPAAVSISAGGAGGDAGSGAAPDTSAGGAAEAMGQTLVFSGFGMMAPVETDGGEGAPASALLWSASLEQSGVYVDDAGVGTGCLARKTTVLTVQFNQDGTLDGMRSVVSEFAGGDDCPSGCRTVHHLQGTKLGQ